MPDALIAAPLARDWLGKLVKEWAKIRGERRRELDRIFEEFGNVELLAETYVEPDCQTGNPVDLDEDEPTPTWAHRVPVRKWLNDFLQREFKARDGRNTLFVLSDAGMGKSSLLMMLKLSHLLRFWPDGPELHLLKLDQDTKAEPMPWARSRPIPGACMTYTATRGSGLSAPGPTTTRVGKREWRSIRRPWTWQILPRGMAAWGRDQNLGFRVLLPAAPSS